MRTGLILFGGLVFCSCFLGGCGEKDSGGDEPPPPQTFTLTVSVEKGVEGFPKAGTFQYSPGSPVNYGYRVLDDYTGLSVMVGNVAVAAEGSITMDGNKTLKVTAKQMVLWKFQTEKAVYYSTPAIGDDGTIYFGTGRGGTEAGAFVAISKEGALKWSYSGEYSFFSPAIDAGGTIYEGKDYSALYAFNQSNGELRWKYPTERFIRASPVTGPDRSVIIATKATDINQTAKLISLSSEGKKNWEYVLENVHVTADDIYSTPSLGADGLIYFGAETGFLYAVKASDGTLAWKFDLKMAVNWSSPVILNDGTLYLGGMGGTNYEGYIKAIKTDSPGYASTPWPRFRHDNKNTGRY